MSDATQKKYQRLIRKLGRLIQAEADERLATLGADTVAEENAEARPWVSAFVDVRWFSDAEGWMGKFRVVLPNGKLYGLLDTTREMKNLFREIWAVRKEDASSQWYGLKVAVSADGTITSEFNNDPKCILEDAFIQS